MNTKKFIYSCFLFVFLLQTAISQSILPPKAVQTLEGHQVEITKLANAEYTVISFWATWCKPCKVELDALTELYDEWKELYDVEIVAVSIDDTRGTRKIKPMVSKKGWPFKVVTDSTQELFKSINGQTIPHTIVIDKEGNIIYNHRGYSPGDEYEIEDLFKK